MTPLSVAVLIPAHNEEATIGELVQAVLDQPRPIKELIVVADSCKDRTAEVARQAGATLVLETSFADKAANQNHALPYITADVVVGFDGDSRPVGDCIDLMVKDLERGYDATCSSILPMQETGFFIEARRFAYSLGAQWWRLCQRQVGRLQVLTGASYAFRTDVIRALGGFPDGLISADMDVTWKLHQEGYKTWYTSKGITLTVDPETWAEYKAQMPRWSAGYFQNIAKYKNMMWSWRSVMVVGTALFDLVTLWWWLFVVIYNLTTWQHLSMFKYMGYWFAGHTILTMYLVSRVVGWKKALKGFWPYTILNFYNKWLYTKSLVREWILGKHYTAWTGRTGRPVEITKMTKARRQGLSAALLALASGFLVAYFGDRTTLMAGLAVASATSATALYPWKGEGKHAAAPKRKGRHAAQRTAVELEQQDDVVSLARLLDPYTEVTTEIDTLTLRRVKMH